LSGKPGDVREFESCQGNVSDFTESQGNVREKILAGKSCLKLFIVSGHAKTRLQHPQVPTVSSC